MLPPTAGQIAPTPNQPFDPFDSFDPFDKLRASKLPFRARAFRAEGRASRVRIQKRALRCLSAYTSRMSHYSVGGSENEYMNEQQTVLKNKKNITDLHTLYIEEEKSLARAYESLLNEVRSDTPMTAELIRYVHGVVFGDLYEWAGRWRTVSISKPGVTWPPPDYLDAAMRTFERELLDVSPASSLASDRNFCRALGHIQGEFLAIHPFREGNARTIKLVTNLLAIQTGKLPLAYDSSDDGRNRYIEAAKAAILKEYNPMIAIIEGALNASKPFSSP